MKLYERLGHFQSGRVGGAKPGYLTPFTKIPKQLCVGKMFRQKILGEDGSGNIIEKNMKNYGIPQGSPISDLLANMYLLDFDIYMRQLAVSLGGFYMRYSDDILVVVPDDAIKGCVLKEMIQDQIVVSGEKLKIKNEKTQIFKYSNEDDNQKFFLEYGIKGKNGLEYLGFRYDGKIIYLRDSTISNLRRRVAVSAKVAAKNHVIANVGLNASELKACFNYEMFSKRFGRVEGWHDARGEIKNWTFWTYAKKASETFGLLGTPITRQLSNHNRLIAARIREQIDKFA